MRAQVFNHWFSMDNGSDPKEWVPLPKKPKAIHMETKATRETKEFQNKTNEPADAATILDLIKLALMGRRPQRVEHYMCELLKLPVVMCECRESNPTFHAFIFYFVHLALARCDSMNVFFWRRPTFSSFGTVEHQPYSKDQKVQKAKNVGSRYQPTIFSGIPPEPEKKQKTGVAAAKQQQQPMKKTRKTINDEKKSETKIEKESSMKTPPKNWPQILVLCNKHYFETIERWFFEKNQKNQKTRAQKTRKTRKSQEEEEESGEDGEKKDAMQFYCEERNQYNDDDDDVLAYETLKALLRALEKALGKFGEKGMMEYHLLLKKLRDVITCCALAWKRDFVIFTDRMSIRLDTQWAIAGSLFRQATLETILAQKRTWPIMTEAAISAVVHYKRRLYDYTHCSLNDVDILGKDKGDLRLVGVMWRRWILNYRSFLRAKRGKKDQKRDQKKKMKMKKNLRR